MCTNEKTIEVGRFRSGEMMVKEKDQMTLTSLRKLSSPVSGFPNCEVIARGAAAAAAAVVNDGAVVVAEAAAGELRLG